MSDEGDFFCSYKINLFVLYFCSIYSLYIQFVILIPIVIIFTTMQIKLWNFIIIIRLGRFITLLTVNGIVQSQ